MADMISYKKLTVEEAKRTYHKSRSSAGREFVQILILKDGNLGWVCKDFWSSKKSIERDMEAIENADALYQGRYM